MRSVCLAASPILAALILIGCASTGRIELAKNSTSDYVIVVGTDAIPAEKHAAEEFQHYVEKSTGVRLPITEDPGKQKAIYIGPSRALEEFAPNVLKEDFESEDYLLQTRQSNLIVFGGRPRGTRYGVYGFLEEFMGCRWLTRNVEKVPRHETFVIPSLDRREKPAFEYREPFFREAFDKNWAAKNRVNSIHSQLDESVGDKIHMTGFVHTFNRLVPPEKYFDEHPEYFSMIDGKRTAERSQLCLTSPEVLQIVTDGVFKWIEENPKSTIFSVSQNDWEGPCECPKCRAIDEAEGSHAGTLITFCNKVAEAVAEQYPDKYIDTLAYMYTQNPPKNIRPHPNLIVRLCHMAPSCDSHPLATCPKNAAYVEDLRGWTAITDKVYVWHYVTNFSHYLMPFPNFNAIRRDIPFYREAGVDGIFCQGNSSSGGGGEMAELRSYVLAKLLWDPSIDVDATINEFLQGVYGRSWKPIREYFDLLHTRVDKYNIHIDLYSPPESGHLTPEIRKRSRELIDEALRSAEKEAIRKRVEKVRLWIDYADIYFQRQRFELTGKGGPDKELVERFIRTAKANGVTNVNEWNPIEPYYESLRMQGTFITNWWILGPLASLERDSDGPRPDPANLSLHKVFEGYDGNAIRWLPVAENKAYLDFTQHFDPSDIVGEAYAFTYLHSASEREVILSLGSNDGVEVWLNGNQVFRELRPHKASPDQLRVPLSLKKGKNPLLIKVHQLGLGWGLYARLMDESGSVKPILD